MKTNDFLTKAIESSLDEDKLKLALIEQVENFIDYDELAAWLLDQLRDSIPDMAHDAAMHILLPF